jgi:hypothetical protein
MSMTATPPGSVPIIKDLLDCRAHGLEERRPCKSLVEGSTAIDGRGHINFAEIDAPEVRRRLIGVEINEDWLTHLKEHNRRTVGDTGWSQEMDTRMPARDLRKVVERICRGTQKESCHIDTKGCKEELCSG